MLDYGRGRGKKCQCCQLHNGDGVSHVQSRAERRVADCLSTLIMKDLSVGFYGSGKSVIKPFWLVGVRGNIVLFTTKVNIY